MSIRYFNEFTCFRIIRVMLFIDLFKVIFGINALMIRHFTCFEKVFVGYLTLFQLGARIQRFRVT